MELNIPAFLDSLLYMGAGMVGILLITLVNIGVINLLNFFTREKK